jgi:methionine-rich copper-binding protein CopC
MGNRTMQEMQVNEIRPLELTINDHNGEPFAPSAAYVTIYDEDGEEVVAEQAAMIVNDRVYTVIGTATSANIGRYTVKWRILYSIYTYYHATDLEIVDL